MTVNRPAICRPRGAGEQPGGLHVDARVDKCGRQPLGEVFQLVRHLGSGAGGQVEVVQLIHADQLDPGAGGGDADRVDDVGEVHPPGELQAQEPGELHRQHPRRGRGRDGHVDDRQPVIIIRVALAGVPLMGAAQLGQRGRLPGP
jgi:hypothetical protein